MTISSSIARNQYISAGATGYDYTFKILKDNDLKVIVTDLDSVDTELASGADYTVSGVGDAVGGRISLTVPPSVGHKVTILRNVEATQEMDLVDNDDFPADVVENAFDKLTMIAQMLNEEVARSAKVPASSSLEELELPEPAAGQHLAWNAAGDGLINSASMPAGVGVSTFMRTVLDDESATSARATLGAFEAAKVSAFAETILDDDSATAVKATLEIDETKYPADYTSIIIEPGEDADHDIIITGACRDADNGIDILFNNLCKRADAAWTIGNNSGGMAPGESLGSDSQYYVLAVAKDDGTDTDVCLDTSKTGANFRATMPDYTRHRLIGAFKTGDNANIKDNSLFACRDDCFSGAIMHVQDVRSSGTNGGTFTGGDWRKRALDTALTDQIPGAILDSALWRITLPAGRYFIEASAPAYRVGVHKTRVWNVTGSEAMLYGTSELAGGADIQSRSFVSGMTRLAATTVIELQHRCGSTYGTTGLGRACGMGVEIYSEMKITKLK